MPSFDALLERFLLDPTTGALPGISDPTIDNVAWHDFAQYEFLRSPVYHTPPVSPPSSGGGSSGGGLGGFMPGECTDWCPGPDPWVYCVGMDVLNHLEDPRILLHEVQPFLSTFSDTINYAIGRTIGLRPGADIPEFARQAKAAFETAVVQGGHLSRLYHAYLTIPPAQDRHRSFLSSIGGWFAEPCALVDLVDTGWDGGPPPPSVYQSVETLAGAIIENLQSGVGLGPGMGGGKPIYSMQFAVASQPTSYYTFRYFKPDTTNVGLQLVFRQEWRLLGSQRGEVVRTLPLGPRQTEKVSTKIVRRNKVQRTAESLRAVESTTEVTDTAKDSSDIVNETVNTSGWHAEASGSIGFGGLGVEAGGGVSEETSTKVASTNSFLLESVQKTANKVRMESKLVVSTEAETTFEATTASEIVNPNDEIAVTYVYSKLQRQYEVFTHLNEVNAVIFVAEDIPETDSELRIWIEENDWIIAKALLDDSFRDALSAISQDEPQSTMDPSVIEKYDTAMANITGDDGVLRAFAENTDSLSLEQADFSQEIQRSLREVHKENLEWQRSSILYSKKVDRLVEHVRRNILHYCRAVWSQEDADQRLLRYRHRDIWVPTEWQFMSGGASVSLADLQADPTLLLDGEFQPVDGSERPIEDVINPAGPIGYHGNYAVFYAQPDLRLIDANVFDVLDLVRQPYIDDGDPPEFLDPAKAYIVEKNALTIPDPIPVGTREDMIEFVPDLRAAYYAYDEDEVYSDDDPDHPGENKRQVFIEDDNNFTDEYYLDYLFRKQFTRQLVLDTNNLVVDIEVGTGSTLESFKRLHRYVDVRKAVQERDKLELENQRLQKRLDADELADPDIENMTIVTGEIKGNLHDHAFPPGHNHHHDDNDDDNDDD